MRRDGGETMARWRRRRRPWLLPLLCRGVVDRGCCRCSAVESTAVAAALLWSRGSWLLPLLCCGVVDHNGKNAMTRRRRDGDDETSVKRGCFAAANALLWSPGLWLRRRSDGWASQQDGDGGDR
ncbi:hypothetical protein ACLOJK_020510 [Asimina triloba]